MWLPVCIYSRHPCLDGGWRTEVDPDGTGGFGSLGVKPGISAHIDNMLIENQQLRIPGFLGHLEFGKQGCFKSKNRFTCFGDRNTPCNIVAAKDGIIHKMIVLDGQPAVGPRGTVKKGQLLVTAS